jgi:tetraacyldisaccharide 4'-kinase
VPKVSDLEAKVQTFFAGEMISHARMPRHPMPCRNFAAMHLLRLLLLPFSAVFWLVVFVRNRFYDLGFFKSEKGELPTIVIGNLVTGGTGKTPHAEYIIRMLKDKHLVAFLSRGYRRNSRGFKLAGVGESAVTIGDEPFQVYSKFEDIRVAVCEDRIKGIRQLHRQTDAQVVVLDDAFQHRRLEGHVNILLTDFQCPYWEDYMLPAGNLRDNSLEKRRADAIIITKCPANLTENQRLALVKKIQPTENQSVFFTTINYGEPVQIHGKPLQTNDIKKVVGFAGLANPDSFSQYLQVQYDLVKFKKFPDHHNFSPLDIRNLWDECGNFASALFTTEKDAVKLKDAGELVDIPIFFLPIEIHFLQDEDLFRKKITEAVGEKKSRNF